MTKTYFSNEPAALGFSGLFCYCGRYAKNFGN